MVRADGRASGPGPVNRFGSRDKEPSGPKGSGGAALAGGPASTGASSGASAEITREAIARRAFEVWVKKGQPQGQDQENWDQAEALLRDEQRWH